MFNVFLTFGILLQNVTKYILHIYCFYFKEKKLEYVYYTLIIYHFF